VCGGVRVCKHDKMKTSDWNDINLCTVVDVDTLSKPIDFGFKKSTVSIKVPRSGIIIYKMFHRYKYSYNTTTS